MQKWTPLTEPVYIKKSRTDKHHELSNLKQEFDFCVTSWGQYHVFFFLGYSGRSSQGM
jgi:hypothetical protein